MTLVGIKFLSRKGARSRGRVLLLVLVSFTWMSCTPGGQKTETPGFSSETIPLNESPNVDAENIVGVAVIPGCEPKTISTVRHELKNHDIACYVEGSLGYFGVSVARRDAARARDILRGSTQIDHGRVRIVENDSSIEENSGAK